MLPWPYDNYRNIYDDWHAIQKAAGIPDGEHYVPKNCRSSCASELIAANVPTVVVKDFLGHATVATTENYYKTQSPPSGLQPTPGRFCWKKTIQMKLTQLVKVLLSLVVNRHKQKKCRTFVELAVFESQKGLTENNRKSFCCVPSMFDSLEV